MSNFRTRILSTAAGILLVSGSLAGCAQTPPELHAQAAEQLRAGVLAVTTTAAAGDYAGAQAALATVQADLLEAASAEDVTSARSAEIQAAINLVSTDLAAAIALQTPAPAPPSDEGDSDDQGNGNNGNGNGNGNGNNGNGNGNGGPATPAPAPVPTEEPTTEPTEPPASDDPDVEPTPGADG